MTEQQFQKLRDDNSFTAFIIVIMSTVVFFSINCRINEIDIKIEEIHKITVPQEKSIEQLKIETLEKEIKKLKENKNETQTTN